MKKSNSAQVHAVMKRMGIAKASDLTRLGISRTRISRLVKAGVLRKISYGLYEATNSETLTVNHTVAEACKRVPHGVICLLSALRFHGTTTQMPSQVWMAIAGKARHPNERSIPLKIVRFSGAAFTAGVESHTIEGVAVRVYSLAKTIADCFKYRNKIGLDIALEALRESITKRKVTVDDLWRFALICRVANVMKPYMESML